MTLRDPNAQRETLDTFAGDALIPAREAYAQAYKSWRALVKRFKELSEDSGKRTIEIQYNKSLVEKFLEIDPYEGEIESTEAEIE